MKLSELEKLCDEINTKKVTYLLSKINKEIEKDINDKGLPKSIYVHPDTFNYVNDIIGDIINIKSVDCLKRNKILFSWKDLQIIDV